MSSDNTKRKKAPNGEPMRFIREIATPFTGTECLIWPFTRPSGTYGTIRQGTVKRPAHRVVCELVHGQPPTPKHQAAHTCGNGKGGCVNPNHLAWKTGSANNLDKLEHGTMARGDRNGSAKLKADQIVELLKTRPGEKIAKQKFGLSRTQYYAIMRRDSWRHLDV